MMQFQSMIVVISLLITGCLSGYIPPGPKYRCPKERLLLHPCTCDIESDQGIFLSCNNTNLASMSVALNNLATFELPIERLIINNCHFGRLYGSLLYKLKLKELKIEDTPIETIDEYSFLGVNETLKELHLINSSLREFPTQAFRNLSLTVLNIDKHKMTELPKEAFGQSEMAGSLLKLHISNGNISTPPIEALQPLRRLKTLDLHGNQIKDLKRNQFKGLRDVEILDLSHNQIPKVDASHLADLTKLSFFNVSHNNLKELTRGAFARNTVLRVLNMSFNQVKKLDSNSFRGMRFLRRLYLSDNLISDVSRGTFDSLQRIGTIDLARNLLKKVDYQMFFQLNLIDHIDLAENNITTIEKNAFKDIYLAHINLSRNAIDTIENEAFINCANISLLDLTHNKLKDIPKKAFDETTYATELQFSYNFFTSLDQVPLQNMSGLKILNVSHNLIETIPKKTFPKLYELHTVDLAHNNLSEIFNGVFQTLFSLRYLNFSYNSLEMIKPSTFGALPTLLELDMSYNKLENIAKSALARLTGTRTLSLRGNKLSNFFILPISTSHLDLSYNEFKNVPENTWPSMNSLLTLDLSHNKLEDNLNHDSFLNLLTVQRLNLNDNGIKEPPWSAINKMASLQYLYLKDNNLTKLSKKAFGVMPTLFELDLSFNSIKNVTPKAFEGLLQLITLNLSNNHLSTVHNDVFHGLVSLVNLDLSQNRINKLDNKTNGVFEHCLSLEKLNLSHNKITFITRKMFPSNPYFPYKLKDVDLSYNSIPVITHDLTFGTAQLESLNLSHNAIADIRLGVIGNLTNLRVLDLSGNQLHDLVSDLEIFRLPKNISTLKLGTNPDLGDLPWSHLLNLTNLHHIDVKNCKMTQIGEELTKLVTSGVPVEFSGNPLHCDCFLRPILRHFSNQPHLDSIYQNITCASPQYLEGTKLYTLTEDRLNCVSNVNTSKLFENKTKEDYEVLPDLKFREVSLLKNMLRLKWRVMKNDDIADIYVIVKDSENSLDFVYQKVLPYNQRKLEIDITQYIKTKSDWEKEYQLCIIARTSQSFSRKFYPQQCKGLNQGLYSIGAKIVTNFANIVYIFMFNIILTKYVMF